MPYLTGISTRPTFDLHDFSMCETDGRSDSAAHVACFPATFNAGITWGGIMGRNAVAIDQAATRSSLIYRHLAGLFRRRSFAVG
jgi:hypothetical protein